MDPITIAFLVVGLLLIASEAVHTSLLQVFPGVAALLVAGLRAVGVLDSVSASLLVWGFTSLGMALPLRPVFTRYLKTGEATHDRSDEDRDAVGEIVEVIEAVNDMSSSGRIRFQGTSWAAQCTEGTIGAGAKVKLLYKDKLVWFVEPLSILDAPPEKVPALAEQAAQKVNK